MQMINLSPDEYNERMAKILHYRNKIYFSNTKHTTKLIMMREIKMGAFLGTNFQEDMVKDVIAELLMEIKGKLYFHQMTQPLRCTEQ